VDLWRLLHNHPRTTKNMDRLSPSDSSPSASDIDEPMFEGETAMVEEPLSPPPDVRGLAQTGSNKRRAPGGPMASQPNFKTRSRRNDDPRAWGTGAESSGHPIRRGTGPEGRREELVDIELAKYLRKVIGDPFDETVTSAQNVAPK